VANNIIDEQIPEGHTDITDAVMGLIGEPVDEAIPEGHTEVEFTGESLRIKPDNSDIDEAVNQYWEQGRDETWWERFTGFFDTSREKQAAQATIALVESERTGLPPHLFMKREVSESSPIEAIKKGFDVSVPGLIYHQDKEKLKESQEFAMGMSSVERILYQASTLAGDLPIMFGGALIGGAAGSPSGPAAALTATGGAFALPAGLRALYTNKIENGQIESFEDFWRSLTVSVKETLKGEAIGIATRGVGGAAAARLQGAGIPAEIMTMTAVGSAMEGRVPEPQDFVDAAILIAGLRVTTSAAGRVLKQVIPPTDISARVEKNLLKIYKETGVLPHEVMQLARRDPGMIAELRLRSIKSPNLFERIKQAQNLQRQQAEVPEGATGFQPREELQRIRPRREELDKQIAKDEEL